MMVLVGTSEGLHALGAREAPELAGREVTALTRDGGRWWALVDGRHVMRRNGDAEWLEVAALDGPAGTCLAVTPAGLLIGTEGAHLRRLESAGLAPVDAFDRAAGRQAWYTPWGDPPDTRSIAVDTVGTLFVNVHVGGVVRSADGGRSWQPTLDIETDVHQVLAHPERPGRVLAAAAVGLAASADGGQSWEIETEGLHAHYLRAVAVAGDVVLVTASTGPRGRRAALYRRPLDGGRFERCRQGLPEWFASNVDTHCLAAGGAVVVFGTEDGAVYASADGGRTFELTVKGLPPVQCVAVA
jgi:photosystem II stability/assembly factor-like uncharacterized protein